MITVPSRPWTRLIVTAFSIHPVSPLSCLYNARSCNAYTTSCHTIP